MCPDEYYEDNINNICDNCATSCKTCNGKNDNNCLSCEDGLYLDAENYCSLNCNPGYFKNNNNEC